MPSCIECCPKRTFPTVKALCIHLRKVHKLNALSDYKCGEKGCYRKFSCEKAFVRHVKKHDLSDEERASFTVVEAQASHSQINVCDLDNAHCDVEGDLNIVENGDSFQVKIMKEADAFVCKYYSKPSLPRNIVQSIVDDTTDFLCNGLAVVTLRDEVMKLLEQRQTEPSTIAKIDSMFSSIQTPFDHLQTEHLRLKHFTSLGSYIQPEAFELGRKLLPMRSKTGVKYKWVPAKAVHVPLGPVLKKFLELPDSLQSILDYLSSLKDATDIVSNIVQCDLWKKKRRQFEDTDIVLPLTMYLDDFESNNNLGPHGCKIGGVYCTIACLPPEIASQLDNIFLSILFYSQDRDTFGAKKVIGPLMKEMQQLERDGVHVELLNGSFVRVYFILTLLLGDNLGIHQLCGFVCSFAWANYPCRFCKVSQLIMQRDLKLDASLLRDKQNYEADLLIQDQSKTGIKERCALHDIPSFHVTENLEGDILHDFDEGISHNIMTFVLKKLTRAECKTVPATFTLVTLNRRMQLFNFGSHSSLYKTKLCITSDDLDNGKLKMTGSEMQCFVRNFGVLIGDLVPESNVYWKLYLCLQRVLDIVVAKYLPRSSIESLQYYLNELGTEYLSHENSLTFKFHKILWHYCSIIKMSGPVEKLSTRRFESKHRQLKMGLYTNMSRVFALISIAKKHQLALCHRFIANKSVLPEIDSGAGRTLCSSDWKDMGVLHDIKKIFPDLSFLFMPTWIDYKGTRYDNDTTVLIDIDQNCGLPIFGEIERIFVGGKSVALMCHKLETLGFYIHFHAFEVKKKKDSSLVIVSIDSLVYHLPLNTLSAPKGGKFVILRHQL